MWLTVGKFPIKATWWDNSLALKYFSQSNNHCIHLSTTNTIYFSSFVFGMSAFAPVEISYSNYLYKRVAEAWICLVSEVVTAELFYKKGVHKKFANFTGKHLCWSLFLIKLQAFRRYFPVKFEELLWTPILKNFCEQLL